MAGQVRAVIDVGTNSVKLLVAEVEGSAVRPLHESSHQTRLGQGFYETHTLQPAAIRETARSVAEFADHAAGWKPASIKVIATSAARDARNKDELLDAILTAARLPVSIISGEQEADWAYQGVTSDPALFSQPLVVMDVGGGSTEFILGEQGRRLFGESFPIGSVRLLEKHRLDEPPTEAQRKTLESEVDAVLQQRVLPHLAPRVRELHNSAQLVGTGGTSTILARVQLQLDTFDRDKIEGTHLSREEVTREKLRLWSLPLAKRRTIIGLPGNRADVILPGVVIFERVMLAFSFDTLRVSTRGIRFAAVIEK
jgi:exopolyphosphatase/guanosine-5'-triphosphate,3'-diphosphate pyrophosphatase